VNGWVSPRAGADVEHGFSRLSNPRHCSSSSRILVTLPVTNRQRFDFRDRGVHRFLRSGGVSMMIDLLLALGRSRCTMASDGDRAVGEDCGDESAARGPVLDLHAQVVDVTTVIRQDFRLDASGWNASAHALLRVAVCRRVMSTRSATTALPVGSAPAPAP